MTRRRRTLPALALLLAVAAGGCGSDEVVALTEAELPLVQDVGSGPEGAYVFRPPDADPRLELPTVVFLHGNTAVAPEIYGSWLLHLFAGGRQVVFPIFQDPAERDGPEAHDNLVEGLRQALDAAPTDRNDVVAVGHSAGGALAEDLAATARARGLPVPRAVLAAYPGRGVVGRPVIFPEVSRRGAPPETRVVAMAGDDDETVGTRWARRIARRAADGRFVLVRAEGADDHLAPQRADPLIQRIFWRRLDELLAGG